MRIPILATLAFVGVLSLSGCAASRYQRLPAVSTSPEFSRLAAADAALPQQTALSGAGGCRVALHFTSTRPHDTTLVLVHGLISDSRAWRFMRPALAEHYDVLAIDLPGCGDSDAPDARPGHDASYAPDAMARALLLALRAHLAGRPPDTRLVFVSHSLGGLVTLRA